MLTGAVKQKLTLCLVASFGLISAWEIFLQYHSYKNSDWNYAFNIGIAFFYLFAFGVAFARRGQYGRIAKNALTNLGIAGLFWGLAFVWWTYYNLILKQPIPYPSFADALFLCAYPLLGLAVWDMHASYGSKISTRSIQQAVIVVMLAAILIFVFLNRPTLSADLGLGKNLLNMAYSLGDVLLLTAAWLELRSGQARKHPGLYALSAFLLLQVAADSLFAYYNNAGKYWNGDSADFLFAASGFLLALSLTQNNLVKPKKIK